MCRFKSCSIHSTRGNENFMREHIPSPSSLALFALLFSLSFFLSLTLSSFFSPLILIFLFFFFLSFLPFFLTFFLRPHASLFLAIFHFLREKNRSTGCYLVGNRSRRGVRGRVCLQFCK